MYKYILDKSSKKFVCPNCNKKTFVKFINVEDNSYLQDEFGRCDRQTNCNFFNSPKQNSVISKYVNPIIVKQQSYLNSDLIISSGKNYHENNLIQFLQVFFSAQEIESVIQKYRLGTSKYWKGSTVFWQIDKNKISAGKIMLFDIVTGKRIKTPFNHIHWVHKLLKLNNFVLKQSLFGLHLINESLCNKIAIVESEKTALIMSLFVPEYIWMATGSKNNFKKNLLIPLKNNLILAYPDKSEFDDWNTITLALQKEGFEIRCSKFLENLNVPDGTDLADIYLESRKKFSSIEPNITLSKTEIEVKRLAKINPEILNLISTFDLVDNYFNSIINID